jgi:hypothetical protein
MALSCATATAVAVFGSVYNNFDPSIARKGVTMTDQSTTETKSGTDGPAFDYLKIEAMVGQLAGAIAQSKVSPADSGDKQATLRVDYQITVDVVKLLSDIRFRCLVFVTAIIAVANALLPGTGDSGTRLALGVVGFLATLGITIYELRNSQLYEAALHRAKILETLLGMVNATKEREEGQRAGLFNERPLYVDNTFWKGLSEKERKKRREAKEIRFMSFWLVRVKHDHGLALIYGAALGGWVYLIADGLLSLPPPAGYWPPFPAGWTQIISALSALLAFVLASKCFVDHDQKRFRPSAPDPPNDHLHIDCQKVDAVGLAAWPQPIVNLGPQAAPFREGVAMRRSKSMLVVAVLGLALGISLALGGWSGLRGSVMLLWEQSSRILGGILVVLSIAVLVRQARSRSAASSQPSAAAPRGGSQPGQPPS